MAVIDTAMGLRVTVESARKIRFDPGSPLTATNVQTAIEQALNIAQPPATAVNVALSPYTVQTFDRILLVDTSGGPVTINMQQGSTRPFDLIIKDDTGHAVANPISVVPNGSDTIDGLNPYVMDSNFSETKFGPQASGYYVKG